MDQESAEGMKILVIDDSVHLRALISAYLKKMGFSKITLASNGREGLERYTSDRPDFVLLDYVMPEMDGITTLREIRKHDAAAVVVMITSISTREKVLELREAGAFSYLLKPFEEPKFRDLIIKTTEHVRALSMKAYHGMPPL